MISISLLMMLVEQDAFWLMLCNAKFLDTKQLAFFGFRTSGDSLLPS